MGVKISNKILDDQNSSSNEIPALESIPTGSSSHGFDFQSQDTGPEIKTKNEKLPVDPEDKINEIFSEKLTYGEKNKVEKMPEKFRLKSKRSRYSSVPDFEPKIEPQKSGPPKADQVVSFTTGSFKNIFSNFLFVLRKIFIHI